MYDECLKDSVFPLDQRVDSACWGNFISLLNYVVAFQLYAFFPVCFESVEIGDWRLHDICCCDSFVFLLSFVGSTGADDNDREFSIGHKGRSGIYLFVCWFGGTFTKTNRTIGRPSWCFPIELHRFYIDSCIQIPSDSSLFLRPNYWQSRQQRSVQVFICPLQDAGGRSASVG